MDAVVIPAKRSISKREDTIAAWCGIVWFCLIIDACYTWFLPDLVRNLLGTISVLCGTAILARNNGVVLSKQRRKAFFAVLLLAFFMIVVKFKAFFVFIYIPLLCILQWRDTALSKMYSYFKNFIIFYAILSILIEILVVARLWQHLPLVKIYEPQDWVQEGLGYVNYFYGFFCIPAANTSLTFYRACGPLKEGGHFIFFLSFVYLAELIVYKRRNIWLILCGILTLSPNFLVLFLMAEIYSAIKNKSWFKTFLTIAGIALGAIFLFVLSPENIKDEVIRIIFERMLEESVENMGSDGIMAILDGRTGDNSIAMYHNFLNSGVLEKLIGVNNFDGDDMMSDYRWLLMYCGFGGTALILWCSYKCAFLHERSLLGLCVLIIAVVAFLQRAWMFIQVYIWIMMLLVTNEYNISQKYHKCVFESK